MQNILLDQFQTQSEANFAFFHGLCFVVYVIIVKNSKCAKGCGNSDNIGCSCSQYSHAGMFMSN